MEEEFSTENIKCTAYEKNRILTYFLSVCCKYDFDITDDVIRCLFCKEECTTDLFRFEEIPNEHIEAHFRNRLNKAIYNLEEVGDKDKLWILRRVEEI